MKIYQINLNDRLGRYFEHLPEVLKAATPYLLLVHPKETARSVAMDLPDWLNDPNCRGVLYVRGMAYAGLSREEVKRIEGDNNQRVHFLSYAVEDGHDLIGNLRSRFARFFEKVASEDAIDWRLIDEPWPESLVAVYLLAKALSTVDSPGAKALLAEEERWIRVWQTAKKEYLLRTSDELIAEALNVDNAAAVAQRIRAYLEELAYGRDNEAICISKKLRHDWLGNNVFLLDAEYLSSIYIEDSADRDSFDEMVRPQGAFEKYLDAAMTLSALIIDGFSPTLLVDDGLLDVLSEASRRLIREALHDQYVEQTEIAHLAQSIQMAVNDLSASCNHFIKDWYGKPPVEPASIKQGFEEIQRTAKILYERLGKLPKGVLLK